MEDDKKKKQKDKDKDDTASSSSSESEAEEKKEGYLTSKGTWHAFKKSNPYLSAWDKAAASVPELKEWDPKAVTPESTLLFLGKRRSGKSVGMKNMAYLLKDQIANTLVISQTEKVNGFYQEFLPRIFVHSAYNPLLLLKLFQRQEKLAKMKEAGVIKDFEYVLVILDDVISDPIIRNDPMLIKSFTEGRHFHLTVMLVSQYPKAVNTRVRGNSDFAFIFRTSSPAQLESLYEDFGGPLEKKVFMAMMKRYTEGHSCVVVDIKANSSDAREMFFKYTFPFPVPEFKLGEAKYWEVAEQEKKKELAQLQGAAPPSFQDFRTSTVDVQEVSRRVLDNIFKR
jgi:hypothetical protein